MVYEDIQRAIDTGATIEITYINNSGIESVRRISDITYSTEWGTGFSHISAFCHTRQEQRTFRIDSISKVTFLDSSDNGSHSVLINPINVDMPYTFNPDKKIFKLYGEEFNF